MNKKLLLISASIVSILILVFIIPTIYWELKGEKEVINKYDNGNIKEKYYLLKINGDWIKDGIYTSYYLNGQADTEGLYQAGERESEWKVYYESGKIKLIKKYHLNKEIGEAIEYYENGNIRSQYYYNSNNLIDGKVFSYYEDGNLDVLLELSNGKKHGKFIKYSPTKIILIQGFHRYDKQDSLWLLKNESNVIKHKMLYNNGKTLSGDHYRDNGTIARSIRYNDKGEIISDDYFDKNGRNCIYKLVGKYRKSGDDVYSTTLIYKSSEVIQIYSDKKYLKKDCSYYKDLEMSLETTFNIRGNVIVSEDSIFFFPKESRKYPSRSYIPSVESRYWVDDSEKSWTECDECDLEKLSIVEFLNQYKR